MKEQIFKEFPVLETERIIMRQILKTDIDVVYDFNLLRVNSPPLAAKVISLLYDREQIYIQVA